MLDRWNGLLGNAGGTYPEDRNVALFSFHYGADTLTITKLIIATWTKHFEMKKTSETRPSHQLIGSLLSRLFFVHATIRTHSVRLMLLILQSFRWWLMVSPHKSVDSEHNNLKPKATYTVGLFQSRSKSTKSSVCSIEIVMFLVRFVMKTRVLSPQLHRVRVSCVITLSGACFGVQILLHGFYTGSFQAICSFKRWLLWRYLSWHRIGSQHLPEQLIIHRTMI